MSKTLVTYFSASGTTAKAANELSASLNADLYEIKPAVPYTDSDLDWTDRHSRTSLECNDPASRPALADSHADFSRYDIIYLGFPIWWYTAPPLIKTFLEDNDFAGKTIVLFATSGGSGLGRAAKDLSALCHGNVHFVQGGLMNFHPTRRNILKWVSHTGL